MKKDSKSKRFLKDVSIYRIGFGIPLNGAIDYTDDETLNQSFSNKRKIN